MKHSTVRMALLGVLGLTAPACGEDGSPAPNGGNPQVPSGGASDAAGGGAGEAGHAPVGGSAGDDGSGGKGGADRGGTGGAAGDESGSGAGGGGSGASTSGGTGGTGSAGDAGSGGDAGTGGDGGAHAGPTVPPGCDQPLDPTVATDFYKAMKCLFVGDGAAQQGVADGTIDPARIGVLRGRILDHEGRGLAGVTVGVQRGPEYGETATRADGYYDLAVNGGGVLTLTFEKDGFLSSQRHLPTEWRRFSVYPDVVLLEQSAPSPPVTLADLTEPTVVRGPVQEDESGERRHRVLLRPGTLATAVRGDGSEEALDTITLRMTEYTVGEFGPAAMPGELPPTSAYTYAIDISTDEARAAGADGVRFDPPIPTYVDNFLGFPAGTLVPNGYFDRAKDAWEPAENGLVIDLVSESGGLAELDITGDGAADDEAALAAAGIHEDERRALADEYAPGDSLWRTELPHLSPWDHNWPFSPPSNAIAPTPNVRLSGPEECRRSVNGSIIGCEDQSLGEELGIVGTPHSLRYQSERMPGRRDQSTLRVNLASTPAPSTAKAIVIETEILGRRQTERIEGSPPSTFSFSWDGEDPYGRAWQGREEARVRIGFVYDGVYERTTRFGAAGNGVAVTGDRARSELVLWGSWSGPLGTVSPARTGLGGWTFDVHDVFDAGGGVVYRGDGTQSAQERAGGLIERIAGTGTPGHTGDGGPALGATIQTPHGFVVRPDGAVLFCELQAHRVRIVYPDGTIDTFAGTGSTTPPGDGGPATEAAVDSPIGLALAPDGTVYVSSYSGARTLRAIAPDGTISTVAGGGSPTDGVGDGGPALGARFTGPHALLVARDGGLLVADDQGNRVRRIAPDGTISTLAGTGLATSTGDGGLATAATIRFPTGIAEAADGSLYVAEFQGHRVRRIRPDGRIETVAGVGTAGFFGDGGSALLARFNQPHSLAIGPDGSLYVTDEGNRRVRRIRPDGTIVTVAGNGNSTSAGDGGSPLAASFADLKDVYYHNDGTLWLLDFGGAVVRRVRPAFPSFLIGETPVASPDGRFVSVFDVDGRHLRTVDALHGSTIWTFGYDSRGQLTSITDRFGNLTEIVRTSAGVAEAIVGPYGARTELTFDANGFLSSVENPATETTLLEYDAAGLLTALTEPLGAGATGYRHVFSYDELGRLVTDTSPSGLLQSLAREETGTNGYVASLAKNGARTERHEVVPGADATDDQRTLTSASGQATTTVRSAAGATLTAPTFSASWTLAGDPRFGTQARYPATQRIDWQTSTRTDISRSRSVVTLDGEPLSLVSSTETTTVNTATSSSHYDRSTRTLTATSPAGRTERIVFDARGLPSSAQRGTLAPMTFVHDDQGRLVETKLGDRTTTYAYDDAGYLRKLVNPLGETLSLERDLAGRVIRQVNPDASEVAFGYDDNGRLTRVAPEDSVEHALTHGPGGLLASYVPPAVAGLTGSDLSFTHDAFEDLRSTATAGLPKAVEYEYDTAGRLIEVKHDGVSDVLTYESTGGRLGTAVSPDLTLAYTYSGALPSLVTYSGLTTGTIDWAFDDNVRVSSETVAGTTAVTYQFDADGLLTKAGSLTLTRDAALGLVTGTSLGVVTDSLGYDALGDLVTYAASISATASYSRADTFDALGRVSSRLETMLGETHELTYGYDPLGRLVSVLRDGLASEEYSYDARGNRIAAEVGGASVSAAYDAQDRLLTYADATYEHTPDGKLLRRTRGAEVTEYAYDALGRLGSVALPDGRLVEYVVDAFGRRSGRKVDGALTHRFMYGAGDHLVADRGASGSTTVSRYVYGTEAHVPDYLVRGGVTYRYVTDAIGSVRLVVNTTTGSVAQRLDYDAFGRVVLDTSPGFQPFGFAGGLYDPDTGLIRFGARDYDPETGRWTAKDPIFFEGGQVNLYQYVGGDPVNAIDPDGLEEDEEQSWQRKSGVWLLKQAAQVALSARSVISRQTGFVSPWAAAKSILKPDRGSMASGSRGIAALGGVAGTLKSAAAHMATALVVSELSFRFGMWLGENLVELALTDYLAELEKAAAPRPRKAVASDAASSCR